MDLAFLHSLGKERTLTFSYPSSTISFANLATVAAPSAFQITMRLLAWREPSAQRRVSVPLAGQAWAEPRHAVLGLPWPDRSDVR